MLSLVFSSQSFLIPIAYAYYNRLYTLFIPYFLIYSSSTVYHYTDYSNPIISFIDLTTSRVGCFFIFYIHMNHTLSKIIPILLVHNIILCYFCSRLLHYYNNCIWKYVHFYLHILSTLSMVVTTYEYLIINM